MSKAPRQERKKLRGVKAACVAFAAVAGLAGCGRAASPSNSNTGQGGASSSASASGAHTPSPSPTPKPKPSPAPALDPEPSAITAFGATAALVPPASDAGRWPSANWAAIVKEQQQLMGNPEYARGYRSFLRTFKRFGGEPLNEMAANVNALELKDIGYDTYSDGNPWVPPIVTVKYRAGDCKDQAALQYAIMRSLGVPEDRLFMAFVSASGIGGGANHMVLLLNTAQPGQPQSFLVLNDGGPVVNSNRYISHGKKRFKPLVFSCSRGECSTWNKPYELYAAINDSSVWETGESINLYGPSPGAKQAPPSTSALPVPATFSVKVG